MDKFTEFILEHEGEEVEALVLQKGRWPDIDVALAADTIAGRRKMRVKAPSWWECAELVYPSRLSVEQCSSEAASEINADIIAALWYEEELFARPKLADLTGGLGVDSWAFSKMAEKVLYVERDSKLAEAAKHNFSALGCKNIEVVNAEVSSEGFVKVDGEKGGSVGVSDLTDGEKNEADGWEVLRKFAPDIIYLDPARRGEGGEKVFKLEDCRPNILELKDKLLEIAGHVMVKLSPMADIDEVLRQLGSSCLRADVISVDGECKEVLVTMERDYRWEGLIGVNCGKRGSFAFLRSDEATAVPHYLSLAKSKNTPDSQIKNSNPSPATKTKSQVPEPTTAKPQTGTTEPTATKSQIPTSENLASLIGKILLEPDKAVMKAGPFKLLSEMFRLVKLDVSTHYYIDVCAKNSESRDIYGGNVSEERGETCEGDVYAGDDKISGERKTDGYVFGDGEIDRTEKIIGLFRQFRILRVEPLNKKTLRAVGQDYLNAEVTARNIPLTTDELRKRLAVGSSKRGNHPTKNNEEPLGHPSDTIHIFALRAASQNLLFITEKI